MAPKPPTLEPVPEPFPRRRFRRIRRLAGVALLATLAAAAAQLVLSPAHGPHDLADDIMSGLNGPLVSIEVGLDRDRRRMTSFTIRRREPNAETRRAVEQTLEASSAEAVRYYLMFAGADGEELASEGVETLIGAGGDLSLRATTSLPEGTVGATVIWIDDGGAHREVGAWPIRAGALDGLPPDRPRPDRPDQDGDGGRPAP
jgi:hypothetical protein